MCEWTADDGAWEADDGERTAGAGSGRVIVPYPRTMRAAIWCQHVTQSLLL